MLELNTSNYIVNMKASCNQLYALGAISCLLFVLSIPGNLILIWTILKNKTLRTTINYLITSLAVGNLFGTIIQLPLFSINAFSCKFIFSHSVCVLMAFSLYFSSNMNNNILAIVCIERYSVICKPASSQRKYSKMKRLLFGLQVSVIIATFWALTPMFGWSEYIYDGVGMSCSINTGVKNANLLSHEISIFFFLYITPISIFSYTGKEIIKTVKESSLKFMHDKQAKKVLKKESHLVKTTFSLIAAFFLSYTPVVICAFISMVQGTDVASLGPMLVTISVLLCRSSLVWPAYLYMYYE